MARSTLRCWLVAERLRLMTWARSPAASVVSRSARTIFTRVGSQSASRSSFIRRSLRGVSRLFSAVLTAAGSSGRSGTPSCMLALLTYGSQIVRYATGIPRALARFCESNDELMGLDVAELAAVRRRGATIELGPRRPELPADAADSRSLPALPGHDGPAMPR